MAPGAILHDIASDVGRCRFIQGGVAQREVLAVRRETAVNRSAPRAFALAYA